MIKNLFTLILILVLNISFSQSDSTQIKTDLKVYKVDACSKLGFGLFMHTMGILHLYNGHDGDPAMYNSFLLYNAVGLGFDILAIVKFCQYKEYKRNNVLIKTN